DGALRRRAAGDRVEGAGHRVGHVVGDPFDRAEDGRAQAPGRRGAAVLKSSVISVIAMIRSTPRTRRVRRLSCTAAPRPPAVTGRRVVTGWRWSQRLVSGTST